MISGIFSHKIPKPEKGLCMKHEHTHGHRTQTHDTRQDTDTSTGKNFRKLINRM
jgi:hypothetical protein